MTDHTRDQIPATGTAISLDDYFDLPETNQRIERIHGAIIVAPAPELYYQTVSGNIYTLIRQIRPGGTVYYAPVDVVLASGDVLQPDVLWLSDDSSVVPEMGKRLRGAPDLVVEILSPSTMKRDQDEKFKLYEAHGTQEYWLVNPAAREIAVWVREGTRFALQGTYQPGDNFSSLILAGGTVSVDTVFEE